MKEPLLHCCLISYNRPNAAPKDRILIHGGLHKIGDQAPYFTITADIFNGDTTQEYKRIAGGCMHEEILKVRPDLDDLVALHLSNIDGVPMHAEANGWYWLTGALGGFGERYHGGSGSDARTPEQCLQIFADHCRLTIKEAQTYADMVKNAYHPRDTWAQICESMKPRWKVEADACIAKHNLIIFS